MQPPLQLLGWKLTYYRSVFVDTSPSPLFCDPKDNCATIAMKSELEKRIDHNATLAGLRCNR